MQVPQIKIGRFVIKLGWLAKPLHFIYGKHQQTKRMLDGLKNKK